MKYFKKFENFTGNFAIFENFLKFSQKNREKFRKFWKYAFIGGSASEIIKKLSWKSNGNLQNFENFHELWEYFLFKKLILIIIKMWFVGYWKSLIILT